jgi:hypothetical protein
MFGMDLDSQLEGGDPGVDNQLGGVLAALTGFGFDLQTNIDESVDQGSLILLIDFQTTDFTNAGRSGMRIYLGENPNPPACTDPQDPLTCRQHLSGTAMFDISPDSPTDALVAGPVVNGVFNGGPGTLTLQIALTAGNAIDLNLIGARAEVRMITGTTIGTGKLAGAIPEEEVNNNVLPAVQMQLADIITEGMCMSAGTPPVCTCPGGGTPQQIVDLFDTDDNCDVTVMEIQTNNIIMSLLAPDVRLCPDGGTTCDLTANGVDALSLGIQFSAVGAVFTTP